MTCEKCKKIKLKKDGAAYIRINKEVKEILKKKGVTPQSIVDDYIDKNKKLFKHVKE